MADKETDNMEETVGNVRIAESVVAVIAGIAANEVEGVNSLLGDITKELINKMGIRNLGRGVSVTMLEHTVTIRIQLVIMYGFNVPEVCKSVQEKVATAVETMTGLTVAEVNVIVADVAVK